MRSNTTPDTTLRAYGDPHGRGHGSRMPTAGEIATRLRDTTTRPQNCWQLVITFHTDFVWKNARAQPEGKISDSDNATPERRACRGRTAGQVDA